MRTDCLDVSRVSAAPWGRLGCRQCVASNRCGHRCGRAPIPGGRVCVMHGGASPQARAAARTRLSAMAELAMNALTLSSRTLEVTMSSRKATAGERIQAAARLASVSQDLLDRTGHSSGPRSNQLKCSTVSAAQADR